MKKSPRRFVPNVISLVRLALILPILLLLLDRSSTSDIAAVVLFLLAVLSDVVDGQLARRWNSVSEWGKALDPIADKLMTAAVVVTLTRLGRFPEWAAWVIVLRDAAILLGAAIVSKRLKSVVSSNKLGKLPAPFLAASIIFHIFEVTYVDRITLYLALVTMAVAAISYATKFILRWNALTGSPKMLR
jgi:CDP-diacylglycerol--glycerol-3-phosphate 3-phosphatidyltransferase